jgi:PKD repeat protein
MRTTMINFDGPTYMKVSSNFSLALYPQSSETTTLAINAETLPSPSDESHLYYWANSAGFTNLKGFELMWAAVLENITDLETGDKGASSSVSSVDQMDCYKVLLVAETSYIISLDNSNRGSYTVGLYNPDDLFITPLVSMKGKDAAATMSFTPKVDGFYYLFVEYPDTVGGLSYGVKVRTNRLPTPVMSGDSKVTVNQIAHFTADGSSDPDGDPITYSWDFDASDGISSESTKKSPTWIFKKGGEFTVTLTVGDGKQVNATNMKVKVNSLPFGTIAIAGIAQINDTTRLNLDTAYTFKADFTDPDKDKLTFHWDFGDNTTASTQNVDHTYADKGVFSYTLNLSVSDPSGGTINQSLSLVFNKLPKATIVELKRKPSLNQKVELTGIGADTDGYIVEYRWDFEGDGKVDFTSKNSTVDHTYTAYGTYNLTFYVVDNNDGIGKDVLPITITKKAAPKADYTAAIAASVVLIVVIVVVVVLFLFMRRKKKAPAPETGPTTNLAPLPPPVQAGPTPQSTYDSIYGPSPAQAPAPQQYQPLPQQPPQRPDPSIPGQRYQPVSQQPGGPALVPPPSPGKPPGPKLVPPP